MPRRRHADDTGADRTAGLGEDEWGDDARRYARLAIAESTRRTYAAAIKSYREFCEARAWSPYPITTPAAARWLSSLAKEGRLMGDSIAGYRSALSTHHRETTMGQGVNPLESTIISTIVEGIRRDLRTADRARRDSAPKTLAFTPTLLREVRPHLPSDEPMATMALAAAALAVHAVLRPSELLGSAQYRDRALQASQITFLASALGQTVMSLNPPGVDIDGARRPEALEVHLLISKTDPFGTKASKVVAAPLAVLALWRWFHLRRDLGIVSTRLFECEGAKPLSVAELLRRLKIGLAAIGRADAHLTGKCFRRGGASALVSTGASDADAAAVAGWASSSMVPVYAEVAAQRERVVALSRAMGARKSSTVQL